MSIINEALKKVQSNLDQKTASQPTNTMTPPPTNPPENNLPQAPLPTYDAGLGTPKAPWDVTPVPPTPTPTPPPAKNQTEKRISPQQQPTPQSIPAKKSNMLGRLIFLLVIFCALIVTTLQVVKKNERLLAEHDIHLRLPSLANIFPKNILPHRNPSAATAPDAKAADPNAITVSAVMLNNGKHIALINDSVYAVGDSVNGMKILKINFQEIVVLDGTAEKTIAVNLR